MCFPRTPVRVCAVLLALLPGTPGSVHIAGENSQTTLQLDLNVPAFQLDVYENGARIQRYRVAVGMPGYRTPRGTFEITSVEWNPWWIPPSREWARNERATPPGSLNPMGRVKLNFMPLYFIHGTPLEASLGRSASHGCVRVANADAISLARLVHAAGTPFLAAAVLDSLVADTSDTRLIVLDAPVSIVIRYDVAEVAADTLILYHDVYSLDARSEQQLARDALRHHGVELAYVDSRRLANRLRSTSRRPLKIALAELLIGPQRD